MVGYVGIGEEGGGSKCERRATPTEVGKYESVLQVADDGWLYYCPKMACDRRELSPTNGGPPDLPTVATKTFGAPQKLVNTCTIN
jgi:hypothetical protein